MNRKVRLMAIVTLMMVAMGNAEAMNFIWNKGWNPPKPPPKTQHPQAPIPRVAAPEIDAASGTSAIAILAGAVFLVAERSRRSRTGTDKREKSDDDNSGR